MKVAEIQKRREEILSIQRKMVLNAELEDRAFNESEEKKYNQLDKEYRQLIHKEQQATGLAYMDVDPGGSVVYQPETRGGQVIYTKQMLRSLSQKSSYVYDPQGSDPRDIQNRFLKHGKNALYPNEFRALQGDLDPSGGYVYATDQMAADVYIALEEQIDIRKYSTVYTLKFASRLRLPRVETHMSDPSWTAEISTGDEDSALKFSTLDLWPHPLAKRVRVSNDLLLYAPIAEEVVRKEFVSEFGLAFENSSINGTGSGEPMGLFNANSQGISSNRDVTAGTSSTIRYDDMLSLIYNVKPYYRRKCRFLMHSDWIEVISKLKDGNGNYLWVEPVNPGGNPKFRGYEVLESDFCPNGKSSGDYTVLFGDFSKYIICDALTLQIKVLDQLYAASNQTGFIGRMLSDGGIIDENAFTRLKLP
jgi:HK97 family phage major capsid protein